MFQAIRKVLARTGAKSVHLAIEPTTEGFQVVMTPVLPEGETDAVRAVLAMPLLIPCKAKTPEADFAEAVEIYLDEIGGVAADFKHRLQTAVAAAERAQGAQKNETVRGKAEKAPDEASVLKTDKSNPESLF